MEFSVKIIKYILYLYNVGNKINNAMIKVIQYALSPITFPIHVYQMKKLDKKIKSEMIELEKIKKKNLLR